MKLLLSTWILSLAMFAATVQAVTPAVKNNHSTAIFSHGGAGTIRPKVKVSNSRDNHGGEGPHLGSLCQESLYGSAFDALIPKNKKETVPCQ